MNSFQCMPKYSIVNFLFIIFLLGILSGCDKQSEIPNTGIDLKSRSDSSEIPNTDIDLKSRSGSYARKSFWEHLPEIKIWADAIAKYNHYEVSAVDISGNGDIIINAGWHEGYPPSAFQFREDGLWVKDTSSEWTGPFVRVGASREDETIYFNRIFGNSCYTSEINEHWCFQSGTIQIDDKNHITELIPELVEMPTYGTPVSINRERKSFLMFVPTDNGWKIFKDTFVSTDDYVAIDPVKATPWRVLTLSK